MKMIEAKREIEERMFIGAPLSLEAMICALLALNEYIDNHGSDSFVSLDINVDEEIKAAASDKLMSELDKGFDSAERHGWIDADDVRNILFNIEE